MELNDTQTETYNQILKGLKELEEEYKQRCEKIETKECIDYNIPNHPNEIFGITIKYHNDEEYNKEMQRVHKEYNDYCKKLDDKEEAIKYNQKLQKKHKFIKYTDGVENSQNDCSHVVDYDLGNEILYEKIEGDKNMEENKNVLTDEMVEKLKKWGEPMTTDKDVEHEEVCWVKCTPKDYINSLVSDWNKFSDEQKEKVCKYLGGERDKLTVKNLLEKFKEIKEDEKSKIHLSASIGSIVLRCSNCGEDLTNLVPEKYKTHATFSGTHIVNEENKIQEKFVFDNKVCPKCGSNTVDADIGIIIENK